jgi:hypothetical protein
MQQWFDYVDLLASIAPRPLLITEGGRTPDLEKIHQAWRLTSAPGNFALAYYPRYSTPEKRPHDHDELFEGITGEEYLEYANVDVASHCFKENIAVPWLAEILAEPQEDEAELPQYGGEPRDD